MNKYNLAALDDKEFEMLVVDLLGAEIGKRVERFKPGKDAGVDGRWFVAEGQEAIVQCKHWIRSGYNALAKHMVKKEKGKIDLLKPVRYILATSIPLSRQNKQSLAKQLAPHVVSESDIIGSEDIEDLLQRHPEIEKKHYKLWLTSSSALQHIFSNAIVGRSQFDTDQIRKKLPLLVKTTDFAKAEQLLSHRRVVIITGAPGIGKTTLAEQLIVDSLSHNYELVSIEEDISEAEAVYAKGKKQVFFFDDFLGRNILEALELKYDSHIVGFINRIRHDETKRFVLTSRSNILNQAKHLTDLFDLEKVDKNEYELRIESLSRLDKAKILYSHIWHSTLPDSLLDELFKDRRYKVVADHKNFNPRLISFITDVEKIGRLKSQDYWDYVVETLNNPHDIWKHLFSSQLKQVCRDLAYLVVLNGRSVDADTLMTAFRTTHPAEAGKEGELEHRAEVAVKVSVGAVLNRKLNGSTGHVAYSLYNPSIADYVLSAVSDWVPFRRYFAALRSNGMLATLGHLRYADIISRAAYLAILSFLADSEDSPATGLYIVELCNMLILNDETRNKYEELIRQAVREVSFDECFGYEREILELITKSLKYGLIENAFDRVSQLIAHLQEWPLSTSEFSLLSALIDEYVGPKHETIKEAAHHCVKKYWIGNVAEYVNEADLLNEVYAKEHYDGAKVELVEAVTTALHESGFDLNEDDIREICNGIDLGEIVDRNINSSMNSDFSPTVDGSPPGDEVDRMIDDLFERDTP